MEGLNAQNFEQLRTRLIRVYPHLWNLIKVFQHNADGVTIRASNPLVNLLKGISSNVSPIRQLIPIKMIPLLRRLGLQPTITELAALRSNCPAVMEVYFAILSKQNSAYHVCFCGCLINFDRVFNIQNKAIFQVFIGDLIAVVETTVFPEQDLEDHSLNETHITMSTSEYFYTYGIFSPRMKALRLLNKYRQDRVNERAGSADQACRKPGLTSGGRSNPGVFLAFCVRCKACLFATLMLSKESPRTVCHNLTTVIKDESLTVSLGFQLRIHSFHQGSVIDCIRRCLSLVGILYESRA